MKRIGILAEDLAGGCLVTVDYSKKAGFPRIAKCIYSVNPCHIDWPILLSANFLLLYRQKVTSWSLLNAGFSRYCHHRCQAVLAGVSVHRRPSGPPLLGVWRPFVGFGRKNRHRSIENFPPEFCWFCRFSNHCSKSTTNSIWRRHVWPGFRHPLDTGLFCLSALLPGREEITGPVDSLQLVPYRKRGIP